MGTKFLISVMAFVLSAFLFSGCESQSVPEEPSTGLIETGNGTVIANAPANTYNDAICDPFGNPNQQGGDLDHGLVGELRWLSDDQPRYSSTTDYKSFAHPIDATLFFGQLNVPTRSFDRGFSTTDGVVLMNDKGNTLYEYFSLHFQSVLKLDGADQTGKYQFALLSDDGAVLQVDTGTGFRTLINNDGVHPTKMGCASEALDFDFMTKIPIKVDYHQGPRYHISLVLLWRELPMGPGAPPVNDSQCGTSGNSRFFNYNVYPSAPTATYNGLLSRGWRPIPPVNFHLPDSVVSNPCASIGAPTTSIASVVPAEEYTRETSITFTMASDTPGATFLCSLNNGSIAPCTNPKTYSGLADGAYTFRVFAEANGKTDLVGASHTWNVDTVFPAVNSSSTSVTSSSVTVNWVTNKPTTTGLNWGAGTATGNVIPEDNVYQTNHSVTFSGLNPNSIYSFRMVGRDHVGNLLTTSRFTVRTAP